MKTPVTPSAIIRFFAFFVGAILLLPLPAFASKDKVPIRVQVSCNEVAEIVKTMPRGVTFDLHMDKGTGQVSGPHGSIKRMGCTVTADGQVTRSPDALLPHELLQEMMPTRGWAEVSRYAAEGPDGVSFALVRKGVLCFLSARISRAETPAPNDYRFEAGCVEQESE